MLSPSIRAAAKRVVAGGLLVLSLLGLVGWWSAIAGQIPLFLSGADPRGAAFGLALSVAMTAMFAGVVVASLGVVTETFARHRDGYLRAMRVFGAVGLVALGSVLVLAVVVTL